MKIKKEFFSFRKSCGLKKPLGLIAPMFCLVACTAAVGAWESK